MRILLGLFIDSVLRVSKSLLAAMVITAITWFVVHRLAGADFLGVIVAERIAYTAFFLSFFIFSLGGRATKVRAVEWHPILNWRKAKAAGMFPVYQRQAKVALLFGCAFVVVAIVVAVAFLVYLVSR